MAKTQKNITAVVFDLDDTLYPECRYVLSGYRAVAEHLRRQLGRNEPFERWLWRRFLAGRTDRAFNEANNHFALGLSDEQIARLVAVYQEHRPNIRPYEHVAGMLSRLHENFRIGLLTDGLLPAQRLKLEALKIGRFFDAVVFTEELGRECWKPSPIGFEKIHEMLHVPHHACAYVADNPAKDFAAPNHLGWLSVQYLQPSQVHAANMPCTGGEPQVVVRSPGELRAALIEQR